MDIYVLFTGRDRAATMRKLKIITAPVEEAFTIEEVKNSPELRIPGSDDDARINALIIAARSAYEAFTGRVLIKTTFEMYLDYFPYAANYGLSGWTDYLYPINLPDPLISVTSIKYYDTAGVRQTLDPSAYIVDTINEPARITLAYNQIWPLTYPQANAVIIKFISGFADASSIDPLINSGLLLWIQQQYDGRDNSEAIERCWNPYKRFSM